MLIAILRNLLKLRYRVKVNGFENLKGVTNGKGRLLLPNHPGLIDPMIVFSNLNPKIKLRPVMSEVVGAIPFLNWFGRKSNAVILPDLTNSTHEGRELTEIALKEIIAGINRGENFLLYPSGHISRSARESLGNRSGVKQILDAIPDANIAIVKTDGLWGSLFTFGATGEYPDLMGVVRKSLPYLLANGIFFGPRRKINITIKEASDLPRKSETSVLNAYLESIYNEVITPNTWVPHFAISQGYRSKVLPEPDVSEYRSSFTANDVPEKIKHLVFAKIADLLETKQKLDESMNLQEDLGMDSLKIVELLLWAEHESGVAQNNSEAMQTIADAMIAANGGVLSGEIKLKAIPKEWFENQPLPIEMGKSSTVCGALLDQFQRQPSMTIAADQLRGVATYRDLITEIFVLKPILEKLKGENLGLMLPASIGANSFYFAAQFAGKIPIQLNFTVGDRNLRHMIESQKIEQIITSKVLVDKLKTQGIDVSSYRDKLFFVDSLSESLSLSTKILARLATYNPLKLRKLRKAPVNEISVVLFTSGSENLPKAVPLSHKNHLRNVKDALTIGSFSGRHRLLAFLPPFHSFGNTVMQVLPIVLGIPVVYSPNPLDASMLAKVIEAYGITVTAGTPTFIKGVMEVATKAQVKSLEFVMTGGESLSESVIKTALEKNPDLKIGEGYGITETGPMLSANPISQIRHGTIGFPMPWVQFMLIHPDTGATIAEGRGEALNGILIPPTVDHRDVEGMLLVAGDCVTSGYLHYSGESPFKKIKGKSFYNTGDIVRIDTDGRFIFRGRLKRFVKIGGEMISMPAIETALMDLIHDGKEGPPFALIADESKDRPELVVVSRVPVDLDAANQFLFKSGFSRLSRISRVIQADELPTLGTGKTNYRALAEKLKVS